MQCRSVWKLRRIATTQKMCMRSLQIQKRKEPASAAQAAPAAKGGRPSEHLDPARPRVLSGIDAVRLLNAQAFVRACREDDEESL